MKAGWSLRKISEIADHSLGKMLDKAKNVGEPQPYLRNLNVRWFEFDLSDLLEMRFRPEEHARYTVRKGDLVICEGGYPGRAAIWNHNEPIHFQKALHRVRFHEPERAKWFLYYLHFRDIEGTLKRHFNGAGIQHFTGEALARFEIPLPPLAEQRRIASILDEAFAGLDAMRANAEKNLQNSRELFESDLRAIFDDLLDRPTIAIGELAEVFDGPHATPKTVSEGPIFLGISSLENGKVNLRETRHVTVDDFVKWTRRVKPCPGDIVFSYETRLGQAAIIPEGLECCLGRRMGLVRPNSKRLDSKFFVLQYISPPFREFLESRTVRGATVDRIPLKDFPTFEISAPPLERQRKIAARLEVLSSECERLENLCAQKLAAIDELKQSILQKAFAGELTSAEAVAA